MAAKNQTVLTARRLTGSPNGFLFSVAWHMEGFCQMEGGFVEGQLMQRRPQVQHVALGAAVGVEALEHVLAEVRREGRLRVLRLTVERARPAALQAAAAQAVASSQVPQDLFHGDLLAEEGEVDLGTSGAVGG